MASGEQREELLARLRAKVAAGRPVIGAGRRHRAVGQVRRGRRRGPDHHLQLGPVPDGRARLAGRADALRRRERDRGGDGRRGAARGPRRAGAGRRVRHRPVPADAPLPGRAGRDRLRRRAELPHRRADRRRVPAEPGRDRDELRRRGGDDPAGRRARPPHLPVRVRPGAGRADGAGRGRRAGPAHGPDHLGHDRRADRADPGRGGRPGAGHAGRGGRGQAGHPGAVPRRADRRARRRGLRARPHHRGLRLLRRLVDGAAARRARAHRPGARLHRTVIADGGPHDRGATSSPPRWRRSASTGAR